MGHPAIPLMTMGTVMNGAPGNPTHDDGTVMNGAPGNPTHDDGTVMNGAPGLLVRGGGVEGYGDALGRGIWLVGRGGAGGNGSGIPP